MVLDVELTARLATGERLVRYEITGPEPGDGTSGHHYTVVLTLENNWKTGTKVLYYGVSQSLLKPGKWDISAR
jgi:hypothetical protein